MGNTNLPQFGAAGVNNSRDTLPGTAQLTDQQRNKSPVVTESAAMAAALMSKTAPLPATEHQLRAPDATLGLEELLAYGGHHNTGYSPSDAT